MITIIDTGSEFLVDRSKVGLPHLRLLLAAVGQPLARGSPWIAIAKQNVIHCPVLLRLFRSAKARPVCS